MIITQLLIGFDCLDYENRAHGDFFVIDKLSSRCGILRKYHKFDVRNDLFYDQDDTFGDRYYLGFANINKAVEFVRFCKQKFPSRKLESATLTIRQAKRLIGNGCEIKSFSEPPLWAAIIEKDNRDFPQYIKEFNIWTDYIWHFEEKLRFLDFINYADILEKDFQDLMEKCDLLADYADYRYH